jgi:hypothetical protein
MSDSESDCDDVANVTEVHGADRISVNRQRTIFSLIVYQRIELIFYWQVATDWFATIAHSMSDSPMLLIPETSGIAGVRGTWGKPQVLAPLRAEVGFLPSYPSFSSPAPPSITLPGAPSLRRKIGSPSSR